MTEHVNLRPHLHTTQADGENFLVCLPFSINRMAGKPSRQLVVENLLT